MSAAHDSHAQRRLEGLLAAREAFLGFLVRRTGSSALAEELLQEAFAKAVERVGEVRDEEAVPAWFYRLLRNAIVDHARREAAAEARLSEYARSLSEPEAAAELEAEACRCAAALVETLKPEYSVALAQVDLGGQAVAEFAAEAGITANNASVRLHRARAALRKRTLEFCRACAAHGCLDCTCRSAP